MSEEKLINKSTPSIEDDHDFIPPEITEVLNAVPEEQRKEIRRMIISSTTMGMISRTSPEAEMSKKVTPEHITSMIELDKKAMDYNYKSSKNQMIFFIVVLAFVVFTVLGIIFLLKDNNPETMEKVLTGLISAVLGAAGGYGVGSRKREKD